MSAVARELGSKGARAGAQARYLPRAWRLARDAAAGASAGWIALVALQGLMPALLVLLSRPLIDAAAAALDRRSDWTQVAEVAVAIALIVALNELIRAMADGTRAIHARAMEDHLNGLIHEVSTRVDLAFYDSPSYYDHLHRARDEARHRPMALLGHGAALAQESVTLVAVASLLVPYGAWPAVALIASALPALAVVVGFALSQHRLRRAATTDERRADYYDWLMVSTHAAAELRVFALDVPLREAYRTIRSRWRGEWARLARRQAIAEFLAAIAGLAVAAACIAWIAARAMDGHASAGDVAMFVVAFWQGQRMMRSLLAGIGNVYHNMLFLGNLFEFLDLAPHVREPREARAMPRHPAGSSVRFEGVGFRYPGDERWALRGFDVEIAPGQVVAFVGANGAGKSTVLKLACRFYDPDEGRVVIDGVDAKQASLAELRTRVSVLFQQPVQYNWTVAENIALRAGATRDEVQAAAAAAGAEAVIERLPRGYETPLGRWFADSTDLSVGEWQRIALARALLRPGPLLILDEPTSAMDAWTEIEWLKRLREVTRGRTTIVITHRFTTAMRADVVHVLQAGRIVESGSHEELLARAGPYAKSWHDQIQASTNG